jgi:hypothetical protein
MRRWSGGALSASQRQRSADSKACDAIGCSNFASWRDQGLQLTYRQPSCPSLTEPDRGHPCTIQEQRECRPPKGAAPGNPQ